MARDTTLLDLVRTLNETTATEAELIETVVHLLNSGTVRLCGIFRGSKIDLSDVGLGDRVRAA